MKEPETLDELYRKARIALLYCKLNINFNFYGNLHASYRSYAIRDWGSFIIMDYTKRTGIRIGTEIPKYADKHTP